MHAFKFEIANVYNNLTNVVSWGQLLSGCVAWQLAELLPRQPLRGGQQAMNVGMCVLHSWPFGCCCNLVRRQASNVFTVNFEIFRLALRPAFRLPMGPPGAAPGAR